MVRPSSQAIIYSLSHEILGFYLLIIFLVTCQESLFFLQKIIDSSRCNI